MIIYNHNRKNMIVIISSIFIFILISLSFYSSVLAVYTEEDTVILQEDWSTVIGKHSSSVYATMKKVIVVPGSNDTLVYGDADDSPEPIKYFARIQDNGTIKWIKSVNENYTAVSNVVAVLEKSTFYAIVGYDDGDTVCNVSFASFNLDNGDEINKTTILTGNSLREAYMVYTADYPNQISILTLTYPISHTNCDNSLYLANLTDHSVVQKYGFGKPSTVNEALDMQYCAVDGNLYVLFRYGSSSIELDTSRIYKFDAETCDYINYKTLIFAADSSWSAQNLRINNNLLYITALNGTMATGDNLFLVAMEIDLSTVNFYMKFGEADTYRFNGFEILDNGNKLITYGWSQESYLQSDENIVYGNYFFASYVFNADNDVFDLNSLNMLYSGDKRSTIYDMDVNPTTYEVYLVGNSEILIDSQIVGYLSKYNSPYHGDNLDDICPNCEDCQDCDQCPEKPSLENFSLDQLIDQITNLGNLPLMGIFTLIGLLLGLLLFRRKK